MTEKIELETVGEIIIKEFMRPNKLLTEDFAKKLEMDALELIGFLFGFKEISEEFDRRLTKYFKLSEGYFLRLQEDCKKRLEK